MKRDDFMRPAVPCNQTGLAGRQVVLASSLAGVALEKRGLDEQQVCVGRKLPDALQVTGVARDVGDVGDLLSRHGLQCRPP